MFMSAVSVPVWNPQMWDGSGCCLVIVTRGLDEHTKLISQFSLWLSDGL